MTNEKWIIADSVEMRQRQEIANDFYSKILEPEEHPMYCSDDASFYAVYFGDIDEAKLTILKEYGVKVSDEDLSMPLWKLLDILYSEK